MEMDFSYIWKGIKALNGYQSVCLQYIVFGAMVYVVVENGVDDIVWM